MIDIHCHLLPGIDDGADTLATSLAMARMAVADGVHTVFCTPHIYPGLYENTGPNIQHRVDQLQLILRNEGIALTLSYGADTHLVPEVLDGIRSGRVPTLGGSRYLLLEPSHHVRPPYFRESVFALIGAGYTPVITHPERLTWVDEEYADFKTLSRSGAWMQVTGGALLGLFGPKAQRLAESFVGEGWADVIASDGHSAGRRAPVLAAAHAKAVTLVGANEAKQLVTGRPQAIIANTPADQVARPPAFNSQDLPIPGKIRSRFSRWLHR